MTQQPSTMVDAPWKDANDWMQRTGRTEEAGCRPDQINLMRIAFDAGRQSGLPASVVDHWRARAADHAASTNESYQEYAAGITDVLNALLGTEPAVAGATTQTPGELAMNAQRWLVARDLLSVEDIERAIKSKQDFGGGTDEIESLKADAAIDAATPARRAPRSA